MSVVPVVVRMLDVLVQQRAWRCRCSCRSPGAARRTPAIISVAGSSASRRRCVTRRAAAPSNRRAVRRQIARGREVPDFSARPDVRAPIDDVEQRPPPAVNAERAEPPVHAPTATGQGTRADASSEAASSRVSERRAGRLSCTIAHRIAQRQARVGFVVHRATRGRRQRAARARQADRDRSPRVPRERVSATDDQPPRSGAEAVRRRSRGTAVRPRPASRARTAPRVQQQRAGDTDTRSSRAASDRHRSRRR